MKSNYKKLGQFIQQVSIKNSDLKVDNLLGVSITKKFIPSIANIIGTDMSTYKIVKKGQFTYGSITSRNGDKISIALLQDEEAIVSTSYTVFEIIDTNKLIPEYLMMWFRRPEFDRYARYMSHGSTREAFGWEEMCDVELPVPTLEKQKKIIKEYHTIIDRIKLNEQLNQKLEDTAQSIYKEWFVNFEFPDENGKLYKSNGGEMVYCDELDMEIPKGWSIDSLENYVNCNSSTFSKKDKFEKIKYLDTSSITNNKIDNIQILDVDKDVIPSRAKRKVKHNSILYSTVRPNLCHFGLIKKPPKNLIVSTGFVVIDTTDKLLAEYIFLFLTSNKLIQYFQSKAEMSVSTYPSIKPEDIQESKILIPEDRVLNNLKQVLEPLYILQLNKNNESKNLLLLKETLLSKMATIEG
ncbi:restriction endonuclease subunit S [Aliarcobacter butzleri]|uniref:restriction endonuclease subunit S n=1 Tax=Aliarcobacter butzleri TaxID=28197 RepID=UPI00263C870B|nr:restriction endonuclease subunit S [Aliarcobacter butzleri]MCG3717701.1 restriction endonuclease subunit S [Aliarcobacter butzleri]MDN5088291.1 restriction endonuclease subunit S [Aliarcobacter butzleri]